MKENRGTLQAFRHAGKAIEALFAEAGVPLKRYPYDTWLKYGHLSLAFAGLAICGVAYWLFQHIKYGL
ncbi:hypothetical protein [Chitinophaga qingshengii]|uniref:Uncharacterized protein n=1 Tax=Chitinophaga qingshengii TaxID=1569794 RepID=A0ABR7TY85_9BACT|nr:hypothetical protein [Chitinophaga qingshengii]MBC9934466.1 hypothetical protein [Chitinophaga qingshengii]